jgi:acyl-CoA thioester hydrolase
VVADAALSFRTPARFDDQLQLQLRVRRLGRTSITTVFEVVRAQETLVTGQLRHVCVSAETFVKTEIPDWVRSGLGGYLDDGSQ